MGRAGAAGAEPRYDEATAGGQPWTLARVTDALYVVLVDEFGEFERKPGALTREELRRICDAGRTKDGILKALRQ